MEGLVSELSHRSLACAAQALIRSRRSHHWLIATPPLTKGPKVFLPPKSTRDLLLKDLLPHLMLRNGLPGSLP